MASDKAIAELRAEVEARPRDVSLRQKLGLLLQKSGDRNGGAAQLAIVARLYLEDGLAIKAVAVWKQVLTLDPTLTAERLLLADLYERLGLTEEAKAEYEAVLEQLRTSGEAKSILHVVSALARLNAGV